ncbi:MAG: DUF6644 family protein [Steroidobacteraceae bacterium]
MESFNEWLTGTAVSQMIQTTSWAIPGLQTIHIICLALLFITALMVTMRVLGRSWHEDAPRAVADRFLPVVWTCLVVLLITGSLLISAEPGRTLTNQSFYVKVVMIVLAVILTLVVGGAARRGAIGGAHKAMAVFSMLLWAGVIIAGRYIAYT